MLLVSKIKEDLILETSKILNYLVCMCLIKGQNGEIEEKKMMMRKDRTEVAETYLICLGLLLTLVKGNPKQIGCI